MDAESAGGLCPRCLIGLNLSSPTPPGMLIPPSTQTVTIIDNNSGLSFSSSAYSVFKNGVADHKIKELCRIYVSRSVLCEFCGNQRSIKAAKSGLKEDDYSDLINFESSARYDERQKAALAYAGRQGAALGEAMSRLEPLLPA